MPADKREWEEITLAENLNARPKVFCATFLQKSGKGAKHRIKALTQINVNGRR